MTTLQVRNFAQIEDVNVTFGDLTVLVGPQGTGKSLLLQWLKMAIDAREVVYALKEAGNDVRTPDALMDLMFGEGMHAAWRDETQVLIDGKSVSPRAWTRGMKQKEEGSVFFIPAHRALLLAEGWPAPFMKLNADTPVVARLFSQNLYQRFSGRSAEPLFPVARILKGAYRTLIDDAVFHGGQVDLEKSGLRYRLGLSYNKGQSLPFMTWTAGQREFTPLMLGLYHLLPPRKQKKREGVDWVVIEEPEMGLHPEAINVVMLLVLDLLWRGYKVAISTHSPLILDIVWAIRQLAANRGEVRHLRDAFSLSYGLDVNEVLEHALRADYRSYFLSYRDNGKVRSRDISQLDPDSEDLAEAYWGGLTSFSSKFADAVRRAVNANESSPDQ